MCPLLAPVLIAIRLLFFLFCCGHLQNYWSKQGRQYVPLCSLYYLHVYGRYAQLSSLYYLDVCGIEVSVIFCENSKTTHFRMRRRLNVVRRRRRRIDFFAHGRRVASERFQRSGTAGGVTRAQCYKTFSARNLRFFVISWSVLSLARFSSLV
jgi:hypothetical protein